MATNLNTNSTRCHTTLKSRLERQLEDLEWEMYLRGQSDDRYHNNGGFRRDDLERAEIRKQLMELSRP